MIFVTQLSKCCQFPEGREDPGQPPEMITGILQNIDNLETTATKPVGTV